MNTDTSPTNTTPRPPSPRQNHSGGAIPFSLIGTLNAAPVGIFSVAQQFVRVSSVPRLIGLLEREGAFTEALELARRLVRFGQGEDVAARLTGKAQALVAEAAAQGGSS
ncbi:hypothetical protein ACFRQM_50590 [Streptomyces sp. NPDC056831]|uniref:hypothetical protein n=1 Tax=Streptomyces sp. NPDC056831 TaxID=3345954 RepID=UPI0036976B34